MLLEEELAKHKKPQEKPTGEAVLAATTGSAKRRSTQCQCCSSPLGELVQVEGTERMICRGCMGFIAMWWIELGNLERQNSQNIQAEPPPVSGGEAQRKLSNE